MSSCVVLQDVSRTTSTCTCDISCLAPRGASTPDPSRRIVDCCSEPDLAVIGNTLAPSPNLISTEACDDPLLDCPSSSQSSPSSLNFTASVRSYIHDQLNKTYEWACSKTHLNNTCNVPIEACPTLEDDSCKRLNKSCEFRPSTRDSSELVNFPPRKRVDFGCMPTRSCTHENICHKFCTACKNILNSAPGPSKGSCRHLKMADKLCPACKELVTPCQPDKPGLIAELYERCKELLRSVSCQTYRPCRHLEVEHKMCKKCLKIIDTAPPSCVRSCRHFDVYDKLCKHCKRIIKSVPCRGRHPCQQHDDKTYEVCSDGASDSSMTCSKRVCESMEKSCGVRFVRPRACDAASDPVSALCQSFFSRVIELVDGSCEPCDGKQPACMFVDTACDPASFGSINIRSSNESSDSCKSKKTKKEKKPKKQKSKKSDPCKDPSCSKACEATPFEPIKVIKIKELCKSCKSKQSKKLVDKCCCPIQPIEKLCILEDKACDPAPFQSIKITALHTSCQTEPRVTVDRDCEPEGCMFVDAASEPAPFQSIRPVREDKGCDACNFILKPNKHVRLTVLKKGERCKSFDELYSRDQNVGPASSADDGKRGRCACAFHSHSASTLANICSGKSKHVARSTSFHAAKESMCRSSGPESPDSSCAAARARYYQNKLLATLQILQNKEETVRVQAESLAVAESRITSLSSRHADLRREIERKEREIQCLRKSLKDSKHGKVQTFDVSMLAEDTDCRENIVTTLQNNLDIIEDLYRESFYETVKQENLIETLRQSNLDIRLMEKNKSDHITKLHNVINTQQWSLERCQDIAADVDTLKMEISNFLNNSNNDSGMWEESVAGELNEDLQDIAAQLLRLRDLLASDCTCGLDEENKTLLRKNEQLQCEISDLRGKISALEANSRNNSIQGSCIEKQYQETIATKDTEISCLREQLHEAMQRAEQKTSAYDILSAQITQAKAALEEKSAELCCMRKQCRIYEDTIRVMKEELSKGDQITKENASLRSELCCVSRRAGRLQRRCAELEGELARAAAHCAAVDGAYRDKIASAVELERQLDEAHARGAELCAEAGRVVRAVRGWATRMKDMHRSQQKQIKEKECRLRSLQRELDKRQSELCPRVWEQREQCCSPRPSTSDGPAGLAKCVRINECHEVRQRRDDAGGSTASEMASCSTSPSCLPKRTCLKKKPAAVASSSGLRRRSWLGSSAASAGVRDASAQLSRCDAPRHCASCGSCHACARTANDDTDICPLSPGEEMFSHMERLSEALADGYKRWTRRTRTNT